MTINPEICSLQFNANIFEDFIIHQYAINFFPGTTILTFHHFGIYYI